MNNNNTDDEVKVGNTPYVKVCRELSTFALLVSALVLMFFGFPKGIDSDSYSYWLRVAYALLVVVGLVAVVLRSLRSSILSHGVGIGKGFLASSAAEKIVMVATVLLLGLGIVVLFSIAFPTALLSLLP